MGQHIVLIVEKGGAKWHLASSQDWDKKSMSSTQQVKNDSVAIKEYNDMMLCLVWQGQPEKGNNLWVWIICGLCL